MRRVLAGASHALLALMLFAAPIFAESNLARADDIRTTTLATLTASGEGSVEVTPDIVVVTMGVESHGKTAAEALGANSSDMTGILAALKAAGIADKDIGTTGFNVSPLYPPQRNGDDGTTEPRIIGYVVSNQVRVTIRDLASSGAVLDKVVAAGANQVSGISFDVSDRVKPAAEALRHAIADAKRKAAIMAEAAGVKLVRVLSVAAGENGGYAPMPMAMAKSMAVPIMAGQQAVSASATIVWEIAPE